MQRYQEKSIIKDLHKKMVFLAGPRQVGKTTLAKQIAEKFSSSLYLTYDRSEDRRIMSDEAWLSSVELLILDEIHKMPGWKNYLKGVYDTKPIHRKILVTGSARLEIFNQVGDSLAGRYLLQRLLPLSPAECYKINAPYSLDRFLERGGFPEPFLAKDVIDANRWRLQYTESLLSTDVLDFENIQHLRTMRLIFELLRERVGSPISYTSIAEDVNASPTTVKKYIEVLEALYIIFKVTPYSNNIARSLLKEPKIYFFDGALVKGNEGVQFENLIATCLLKHVFAKVDLFGEVNALHYLQTKEKHEVDFTIANEEGPQLMIEAKNRDSTISPGLRYFYDKYKIPAIQLVKDLKRERVDNSIEVRLASNFLPTLEL